MTSVWIFVLSPVVGYFVIEGALRIFSDDDELMGRIVREQPVTMIAATAIVGSIFIWGLLSLVGLW